MKTNTPNCFFSVYVMKYIGLVMSIYSKVSVKFEVIYWNWICFILYKVAYFNQSLHIVFCSYNLLVYIL